MIPLIIVIALVAILVGFLIVSCNGLVRSRNQVENAWSQIDIHVKRRLDLLSNLVEAVNGAAAHQRETMFNLEPKEYVEAKDQARTAPTVQF